MKQSKQPSRKQRDKRITAETLKPKQCSTRKTQRVKRHTTIQNSQLATAANALYTGSSYNDAGKAAGMSPQYVHDLERKILRTSDPIPSSDDDLTSEITRNWKIIAVLATRRLIHQIDLVPIERLPVCAAISADKERLYSAQPTSISASFTVTTDARSLRQRILAPSLPERPAPTASTGLESTLKGGGGGRGAAGGANNDA